MNAFTDYTESSSRQRPDGYWEHVLVWNAKPFTINDANRKRWAWIEARAEWREAYRLMAQGCAPLDSCHVHVQHLLATRRNVDVGACMPSVKAAVDGVVLAGVLADDDAAHVTGMTFQAPRYAARDALIVELIGPGRDLIRDRTGTLIVAGIAQQDREATWRARAEGEAS